MSEAQQLGPLLHRFEVDARDQQVLSIVRLVSALLALLGVALLLLSDVPLPVFLVALLGGLMALVWLGKAARARRLAREADAYHLCIHRDGFVLTEAQAVTAVRYDEIEDISVDEERLDIVVKRTTGAPLRLEPRYPGVEIHELVHTLRVAAQQGAHHVRA